MAAAAAAVALLALGGASAQASNNVVVQSSLLPRLPTIPGMGREGRAGPTVVSVDPTTGQATVVQQRRAVSPGVDVRRDPVTGATVLSTSGLAPLGANGHLLPPVGGSRPVYVAAGDGSVVQVNAPTLLPSLQQYVPPAVNRKAAELNAAWVQLGDKITSLKNKGQAPAMTTTVTTVGGYRPLAAAARPQANYAPTGNHIIDKKNEIASAVAGALGGGGMYGGGGGGGVQYYGGGGGFYPPQQATQVVTAPRNGAVVAPYSTAIGYTNNNVVYSSSARLASPAAAAVVPMTASPDGWKAPQSGCPAVKDAVVVGPGGAAGAVSACTFAVKKELTCGSLVKLGQLPAGSTGVLAPDGLSGASAFPPGAAGCAGAAAIAFSLDDKTIAFESAGAAVPALALIVRAKELGSAAYFFGAEGATAAGNLPAFSPGDALDALWKVACEKFDKEGKCASLNKKHPGIEGELCYLPPPTAVQVAQSTTYGAAVQPGTASWTLGKRARLVNQPPEAAAVALFRGDAQDTLWTLQVTKSGEDSTTSSQAAGSLVVSNPSIYPVTLTSIDAGVQGGPQATVVCDRPLPIQLDACGAVTCQHVAEFPGMPQPGALQSVAAVQYVGGDAGAYGGGATVTGTTPLVVPPQSNPPGLLTAQGTVQPGSALVTDPMAPGGGAREGGGGSGGGAWTFSAGGTASYVTRIECPADSGVIRNTATLTASTGQQASTSAEVQRLCYDLNVRVGRVASTFAGSYQWRVQKAASDAEAVLAPRPPPAAAAPSPKALLKDHWLAKKGAAVAGVGVAAAKGGKADALSDFLSKLKSAKDALLSPAESAAAVAAVASAPATKDVTYRVTYTRTDPTGFVSGAPAYPVLGDVFVDNPAPLDAPIAGVRVRIGNPSRSGAPFEAEARCVLPGSDTRAASVPAGGTLQCVFDAQPDFNPAGQQMFATVSIRNTYNGQPTDATSEFHSLLGTVGAGGVVRRSAAAALAPPSTGSAVRQGSRNVAADPAAGSAAARTASAATAVSNQRDARMGGTAEVPSPAAAAAPMMGRAGRRALLDAAGYGGADANGGSTWGGDDGSLSGASLGGDAGGAYSPEFGLAAGGGLAPAPVVYAVPSVPVVQVGAAVQPSSAQPAAFAASGPATAAAAALGPPENGLHGKVQTAKEALAASAMDAIAAKEMLKAAIHAPKAQPIYPSAAAAQAMQIAALQAAAYQPYVDPKKAAVLSKFGQLSQTLQNSIAASLLQDDAPDAALAFARALDGLDGEPVRDAGVFTSNAALAAARALVDPASAEQAAPVLLPQPTPAVARLTDACVDVYDGFSSPSSSSSSSLASSNVKGVVVSGTVPSGRICESRTFVYTVRYGPFDGCFEGAHLDAAGFAGADSTSATGTATSSVRVRVSGCPSPAEAVSVALTGVRAAKAASAPAGWTVAVDASPSLLLLKKGAAGRARYTVSVKRVGAGGAAAGGGSAAALGGGKAGAAALVGELALANPSPVPVPVASVAYTITELACPAGAAQAPFSGAVACPAKSVPAAAGGGAAGGRGGAASPGRLRCVLSAPLPCPGTGKVEILALAADGTELYSDAVPFSASAGEVAAILRQSAEDEAAGDGADDDSCATVTLGFAKGGPAGKVLPSGGRGVALVPGRLLSDVGSAAPAPGGTRVCADRVFSFTAAFGGFGDCSQRAALARAAVVTGRGSTAATAAADEAELPISTVGCPVGGSGVGALKPESGSWTAATGEENAPLAPPARRVPRAGVNCVVPALFWAGCVAAGSGDKCAAGWASLPGGRATPLAHNGGAPPAPGSGVPATFRAAAASTVTDAGRGAEAAVARAAKHLAAAKLNLASGAAPPAEAGEEMLSVVAALQAFFEGQAGRTSSLADVGGEQEAVLDSYSRVLKRYNTGAMGVPACGSL